MTNGNKRRQRNRERYLQRGELPTLTLEEWEEFDSLFDSVQAFTKDSRKREIVE